MSEKISYLKITLVLLIVFLFPWLYSSVYQVGPGEAAVLNRIEKLSAVVTEPGLHFKWPWPVESVSRMDMRVRSLNSPLTEVRTADGKVAVVRAFALWRITDPAEYVRSGLNRSAMETQIGALLSGRLRAVMSGVVLDSFFEPSGASFKAAEAKLSETLNASLSPLGIGVPAAGFDRFELPGRSTEAAFERLRARYQSMAQGVDEMFKRQTAELTEKARLSAAQTEAKAELEASKMISEAEAQAFAELKVYDEAPELARFLQSLEAAEKMLGKKTTLILSAENPLFRDYASDTVRKELE